MKRYLPAILAVLAAAGIAGVTIALVDSDGDGKKDRVEIRVISVDGPDRDVRADREVQVLEPAIDGAVERDVAHAGEGVSEGDQPEAPTALDGDPLPLAAQDFPGCRTQFVRNQSSRGGVVPRVIVWHYTVSRERPGWGDNDVLTGMANNPGNGVSWHFSIGRSDGLCAFNVPLSMKAWTQGNANPFSVGIEVIAYGDEGQYVTGAGRARLIQVTRELGKRLGIPMQRGQVSNCQVVRPGIVRHVDLGACGGGHHDTNPFPDPIAQLLPELGRRPVSARDRRSCRKVNRYRHRPARAREKGAEARQKARLEFVRAHGLRCVKGKPVPA